ncbi:hypothetical protein Efla_006955 [Eimeria flavescens]
MAFPRLFSFCSLSVLGCLCLRGPLSLAAASRNHYWGGPLPVDSEVQFSSSAAAATSTAEASLPYSLAEWLSYNPEGESVEATDAHPEVFFHPHQQQQQQQQQQQRQRAAAGAVSIVDGLEEFGRLVAHSDGRTQAALLRFFSVSVSRLKQPYLGLSPLSPVERRSRRQAMQRQTREQAAVETANLVTRLHGLVKAADGYLHSASALSAVAAMGPRLRGGLVYLGGGPLLIGGEGPSGLVADPVRRALLLRLRELDQSLAVSADELEHILRLYGTDLSDEQLEKERAMAEAAAMGPLFQGPASQLSPKPPSRSAAVKEVLVAVLFMLAFAGLYFFLVSSMRKAFAAAEEQERERVREAMERQFSFERRFFRESADSSGPEERPPPPPGGPASFSVNSSGISLHHPGAGVHINIGATPSAPPFESQFEDSMQQQPQQQPPPYGFYEPYLGGGPAGVTPSAPPPDWGPWGGPPPSYETVMSWEQSGGRDGFQRR